MNTKNIVSFENQNENNEGAESGDSAGRSGAVGWLERAGKARAGKIARLPKKIRDELNERLEDNIDGPRILEWLNAEPEVKEVMEESFEGAEITLVNLSNWRQGGFRDWQLRRSLLSATDELGDCASEIRGHEDYTAVVDNLATVMAARYAAMIGSWDGSANAEVLADLAAMQRLCRDVVAMQKSMQQAARAQKVAGDEDEARAEREFEKLKDHLVKGEKEHLRAESLTVIYGTSEDGRLQARRVAALENAFNMQGLDKALKIGEEEETAGEVGGS